MEELKNHMKQALSLDVRMVISKMSKKGILNRDSALEAGAYIAAQFITRFNQLNKENAERPMSRREGISVFEALQEIYADHFDDEYSEVDYELMMDQTGDILNASNPGKMISIYFNKVLKVT